jgi:peroxiredoxin Q/BCP
MSTPKIGGRAPAFVLPDQEGKTHALKDYAGSWVLLYFYPKDDTPGCTVEACTLRDHFPKFKKLKAVVLGVSVDPVKKHAKFAEKYDLPFTLLATRRKRLLRPTACGARKSSWVANTWARNAGRF